METEVPCKAASGLPFVNHVTYTSSLLCACIFFYHQSESKPRTEPCGQNCYMHKVWLVAVQYAVACFLLSMQSCILTTDGIRWRQWQDLCVN